MAFCGSCGNQLAEDERFCPKCGADQGAKPGAPAEGRESTSGAAGPNAAAAAAASAAAPTAAGSGAGPAAAPAQYFSQYSAQAGGQVPVAAGPATTPPGTAPAGAGMQNQNKIWAVVIGAVVLFAVIHYSGHFSGHSIGPQQQQQSGPINLIFVVSEDLAYQSQGDVNPNTANLTSQGLERSLLMGTYLHQLVGGTSVNGIYVLAPASHLQTAGSYPDMVAAETVQQFAQLTPVTMSTIYPGYGSPYTTTGFPVNASLPSSSCTNCEGLDFQDQGGDNEALVSGILAANVGGSYVFSAPWETTYSLLARISQAKGYNLTLPTSYQGANAIYVVSITAAGSASLVTYDSKANPPATYPTLRQVPTSACAQQTPFNVAVTGGVGGAQIPARTNTNETLYIVRHAEAHPQGDFDDGNYVGAGQWRALDLPFALEGKIHPTQVYSVDPDTPIQGSQIQVTGNASGVSTWSYVRPSLTVEPYAIAYNLPFRLAEGFDWSSGPAASNYFFNGGGLSNSSVLLAWEHASIPHTVNALISSYFPQGGAPTAPDWPDNDYDTVWTVTLDGQGNLTVNNSVCEGIQSTALPAAAPQF
ncbi:MAG TPA: zinc-ribbon domain-containing protein [Acidobacteriaceae bacterium]